jgi:flagellar biosynthesis/type III secretory pathway protein FliH
MIDRVLVEEVRTMIEEYVARARQAGYDAGYAAGEAAGKEESEAWADTGTSIPLL